MLGVLKRRWKPKRVSNGGSRFTPDLPPIDVPEKPARISASVRQVHPVCDDKTQLLAYEKGACVVEIDTVSPPHPLPCNRDSSIDFRLSHSPSAQTQGYGAPAPYSKRASIDSNPSPVAYPLTPNICVESGRIEFIKQNVDVAVNEVIATPVEERITVTRSTQTEGFDENEKQLEEEKEKLEIRIAQLEIALESAQASEYRDKQLLTKLQRQISRRESSQRDADRERRLRAESEARTKQALQEASRCRSRLKLLTNEFNKMEETLRSMLVYKNRCEQLRQEKSALTVAFENRCQQYQTTISRLNEEISSLRQQLDQINLDPTIKKGTIVAQTAALHRQAEESRKQYERCLDDVANQVVKALLAQKGLREEISNLNKKIQDLELQNCTLTSMILHQLRGDTTSLSDSEVSPSRHLALDAYKEERSTIDIDISSPHIVSAKKLSHIKHCNSFNSDIMNEGKNDNCVRRHEKHLSADLNIFDNKLSLEDKKRHQVLNKLWTELKDSEVTPKRLLEALSAVDPSFRIPPQRPVSLNLHLPIYQAVKGVLKTRPILAQSSSKSEEETTGNESPESGNRDEGYSTMSSDVQAEVTKTSEANAVQLHGLEELKEVIDESDIVDTRLLPNEIEDDVLYIPINLLSLNPRNSYPPTKDIFPFQHSMRSFSDSHLCIKISTSPSPCYSLSSPISSSPSVLLLDITEKKYNPLRRTKATSSLIAATTTIDDSSSFEDHYVDCTGWDAEYIQHWLLLDETRSAIQQHQRDLLELEYDRTELEDWSLSLSSDDLRLEQAAKKIETVTTPGQISLPTLPCIQENNTLELEEDVNECLWNSSSYMTDHDGHEIVTLLMDTGNLHLEKQWPYAMVSTGNNLLMTNSPENSSWSSNGSDCCHSYEPETYSKRSSAALSGCSDDTGEISAIGTDFTRDFYRLVKFESTKSLASTSSRSIGGALSENGDREMALQNVLTFIAEQQKFSQKEELKIPSCEEVPSKQVPPEEEKKEEIKSCNISYAEEVCLVTPLDFESENCSNISDHPVDICSSVNVEEICFSSELPQTICDNNKPGVCDKVSNALIESNTSNSDVTTSKIPRLKNSSKTPNANRIKSSNNNNNNNEKPLRLSRSKIPYKKLSTSAKSNRNESDDSTHVITSVRLPPNDTCGVSNVIEGPPHRAVSFHERATSKDVIDELNRIIQKGDDDKVVKEDDTGSKLDGNCKATGWIHLEKGIDLTDPKARANLLDVMMGSVSSDSSPTSSCGGSISDSNEEPLNYGHLHRIHRFHRQKKVHAQRPECAVVRLPPSIVRPSIAGRPEFFVRFGEKEREAVASFDFLDELSCASSHRSSSSDEETSEDARNLRNVCCSDGLVTSTS